MGRAGTLPDGPPPTAPPPAAAVPAPVAACSRCRAILDNGEFALSLAFRPRGVGPGMPPQSSACFPLCPRCAQSVACWAAEDRTAPPEGPNAR